VVLVNFLLGIRQVGGSKKGTLSKGRLCGKDWSSGQCRRIWLAAVHSLGCPRTRSLEIHTSVGWASERDEPWAMVIRVVIKPTELAVCNLNYVYILVWHEIFLETGRKELCITGSAGIVRANLSRDLITMNAWF